MKLRLSLLALGLSLAAAPAFASGNAVIQNATVNIDLMGTFGLVTASGDIDVSSKSAAVADQNQDSESNASLGDGDHIANLGGNALSGAQGNIGVNVASGVGNAQHNGRAIASATGH
jgi:hypothetical protein